MITQLDRINVASEKKIITGMIVSDKYLLGIYPILQKGVKLNYFKNKFTRTVAKWCLNFFEKYNKAPFLHIEDIFRRYQDVGIDPDETDLIAKLLTEVSRRYELNPDINVDYLLDNTIEYFDKRELEIRLHNACALLDDGKVLEAKEQARMIGDIEKEILSDMDPASEKVIKNIFNKDKTEFFIFPGQLGEFLGNMKRSWLVGVTGPFKRGKSFFLMEFAVIGVLSGLSVVVFTLEMSFDDISERFCRRVTGFLGDNYIYPCFDCKHNQDDSCIKPERRNKRKLLDPEGKKPAYHSNIKYQICTECRFKTPDEYEKATWFEEIQRPDWEESEVLNYMENFKKLYGNKVKVISYPRFSASIRDIKRDLNRLQNEQLFHPDLIIVDYADILKSSDPKITSGIEKEDNTWMELSGLAGERNALVVTGTQATKQALDVSNVTAKHTARWIGKLGHVDMMLSLNQLESEKKEGILRIGIMEHRHRFFLQSQTVDVLQKLAAGQVHLDSQI